LLGSGWSALVNVLNVTSPPAFLPAGDIPRRMAYAMNLGDFIFGVGAFLTPILVAVLVRTLRLERTFPVLAVAALVPLLAGLGVGLVILLPVYVLRVMGAGDVKLMAMVGAIVGLPDILNAVLYSLIVGGIAAVAFALYHRAFRRMSANVMDIVQSMAFAVVVGGRPTPALSGRASIGKLPYGVSIAAGTIAWLGARLFGLA